MIDLKESIVLILSADKSNTAFGTGFVLQSSFKKTLIITCAHVVSDAGGELNVRVEGYPVTIYALSDRPELDLAILYVDVPLNREPLRLSTNSVRGIPVCIAGFQRKTKNLLIVRSLMGRLGEELQLLSKEKNERIKAWDVEIDDDYFLQSGYSGAPVVNAITGEVVGLISHKQDDQGKRGIAISINNLHLLIENKDIPALLTIEDSNASPQKEESRLYGRERLIQEILNRTLQDGSCRTLIRGVSGIGKTALMRVLNRRFLTLREVSAFYEIDSSTHSLAFILTELLSQILVQVTNTSDGVSKFQNSLHRLLSQKSNIYASMVLQNTAKNLSTDKMLIIQSLLTSSTKNLDIPDASAFRVESGEYLAGFLSIITALSENEISGSILIDRIEGSSEFIHSSVNDLIMRLPSDWPLIISCNDETPEGIDALERIQARMAYINGTEIRLLPLSIQDLEEWVKAVRGQTVDLSELGQVLNNCDGRPLFLQDWVSKLSSEASRQSVIKRISAYYTQRIKKLTVDARHLLRYLSIMPSHSIFSFDSCESILKAKSPSNINIDTYDVLSELETSRFLERYPSDPNRFVFVHDVTQKYVFDQLPSTFVATGARVLLAALEVGDLSYINPQQAYTKIVLSSLTGYQEEVLELSFPTAKVLIHNGSYILARQVYEIGLKAAEKINSVEGLEKCKIGIASICHDTGYYEEGMRILDEVDITGLSTLINAHIHLLRGEILLRMNKYKEALKELRRAESMYKLTGDSIGQISTGKCKNVVLRDLGKYEQAVKQAYDLVKRTRKTDSPPLIKASCLRALARSLAFVPKLQEALSAANEALQIAVKEHSMREEGNAHLAIGESYRHGGVNSPDLLMLAVKHYKTAIEIGSSILNRDSVLWSSLGLADAFLLLGQLDEAQQELNRIAPIVVNENSHPLEHAHWQLSEMTIKYLKGTIVEEELWRSAGKYEKFAIDWPKNYIGMLVASKIIRLSKSM